MEYGNVSLFNALQCFREHYPDAETLDGVVPQQADEDKPELTRDHIDLIRHYLTVEGDAGGLNHPLVLHRENLDIRILETGLQLVVYPYIGFPSCGKQALPMNNGQGSVRATYLWNCMPTEGPDAVCRL